MRGLRWLALVSAVVAAACASAPLRPPQGPTQPAPDPDVRTAFAQATASCRTVRTFTAEIGLSGHFGAEKIRGRVLAGFDRTVNAIRLEAPAPFGAPAFILVAREDRATVLLPRSDEAVLNAPLDNVIEALTGLKRNTGDLMALLTGCLVADGDAQSGSGRRFDAGWLQVAIGEGTDAYLRAERQQWRLVYGRVADRAGDSGVMPWIVSYSDFATVFPSTVRLVRANGRGSADPASSDMRFAVTQVESNVPIDAAAFLLKVPERATRISVEELRQRGPLADRTIESRQ